MDTVVVTGATGGIGRAVTTAFLDAGDRVLASDRDRETLEEMVATLGDRPGSISGVVADVRDEYDLERLAETAARRGDGIDVLVPCAAVHHGTPGETTLVAESYAAFDDTLRTNVRGVFATIREATPHLAEGSRVLVPTCPVTDSPGSGEGAYAVSKAAAETVAAVFAAELEAAVAVVDPGVVATALTGEDGRDPADAADLFLEAANRPADAVNGERIDHRSRRDP
ncbi:MAG: SDR family NAD(P)-dependent oxidoreductase [Halobacteriaceae archaeon]